jgi:hypothetical protein
MKVQRLLYLLQLFLQVCFEYECIEELFHEFLFVCGKLFHFSACKCPVEN